MPAAPRRPPELPPRPPPSCATVVSLGVQAVRQAAPLDIAGHRWQEIQGVCGDAHGRTATKSAVVRSTRSLLEAGRRERSAPVGEHRAGERLRTQR